MPKFETIRGGKDNPSVASVRDESIKQTSHEAGTGHFVPTGFRPMGKTVTMEIPVVESSFDWSVANSNIANQASPNKPFIRRSAPSSNERTDPDMSDFSAKDYVDISIEAVNSKSDAISAKIFADLDILKANTSTKSTVWGAALTGVVAILGIVAGFLAYGGDRFDGGVQLTASSIQYAIDAQKTAAENSKQIQALAEAIQKRDTQIDAMFELLKNQNETLPQ